MQRREKSGSTSFNRHLVTNWLACRKMTNASSKWWRWELKNQQGNREMSIPFCLSTTLIPNKRPSSVNPLNGLICTLNRKPKMKEDYFQFMGKVCKCGHAVPAPEDELLPPYIPKGKNHWNAPNWTGSRQQESVKRDAYGTYPLWSVSSQETRSDPHGVQFVSRVPRGLAQ